MKHTSISSVSEAPVRGMYTTMQVSVQCLFRCGPKFITECSDPGFPSGTKLRGHTRRNLFFNVTLQTVASQGGGANMKVKVVESVISVFLHTFNK